jgi:hypothetical protein
MGKTGRLSGSTDEVLVHHAMNHRNNRADIFTDEGDHEAARIEIRD